MVLVLPPGEGEREQANKWRDEIPDMNAAASPRYGSESH
jgi:hypothetical protein